MPQEILLLEDDDNLNHAVSLKLKKEGYTVHSAFTVKEAFSLFRQFSPSLVICDITLPDGNGLDFCSRIRQESDVLFLFLTALDREEDIVAGYRQGADDYITKPFSLAVLRARVNAQLRRTTPPRPAVVELDGLSFDFEHMEFRRDGQSVTLSKTEQKLLRLLLENRGQVLSRDTLLDRVWGTEFVDENALSVAIKRLRDKLEDNPSKPRWIKTVYGVGYTWAVKRDG